LSGKVKERNYLADLAVDGRITNKTKQTPWPESVSELYRPSDCRLSANLVPTFADRGVA
jgi:hypothetical protein